MSPAQQARHMFADAVQAQGPAWRNAADSIRAGNYGNAWTVAAIGAIEKALRTGADDDVE